MEDSNSIKLSIRITTAVHEALVAEAGAEGREINEFVQRMLTERASEGTWIDPVVAKGLKSRQDLEDRFVEIAVARNIAVGVTFDHQDQVFLEAEKDADWRAGYTAVVGGNAYARKNHAKADFNRLLGMRSCRAVGGKVALKDGKPIKRNATSPLITTFTELVPQPPKKKGGSK
jgi:hypothetical protein